MKIFLLTNHLNVRWYLDNIFWPVYRIIRVHSNEYFKFKVSNMIKSEAFTTELQELAKFSKVISHPARLAILQFLAETKTCISGDISDYIPLSRSTVSQHLKELKESGLIQGEVDGLKINYCLCNSQIAIFKKMFDDFFKDMTTIEINCDTNCK